MIKTFVTRLLKPKWFYDEFQIIEDLRKGGIVEHLRMIYYHDEAGGIYWLGHLIRSRYGLWHTNPLTKTWRDGAKRLLSGVDYTANQPDNLSDRIARYLLGNR